MIIHFDTPIKEEDICPYCKFGHLETKSCDVFILKQCDFCEEWITKKNDCEVI